MNNGNIAINSRILKVLVPPITIQMKNGRSNSVSNNFNPKEVAKWVVPCQIFQMRVLWVGRERVVTSNSLPPTQTV